MTKSDSKRKKQKKDLHILSKIQIVSGIALLIALSLINLSLYFSKTKESQVLGVEKSFDKEIYYWQDFLFNNPTYINGWLKLAELEYQKGDTQKTSEALKKAFEIDPNSEELKSLKSKFGL